MIGPNASLSVRGAWIFMGLASFGTLACAAYCTWLGFWPVLPFAGLELAALGFALMVAMRRNRYREVVSFSDTRVSLEVGTLGRGAGAVMELPRGWTRAWMEPGVRPNDPARLMLGCSGQKLEIGRCLTQEEREALLARFRALLRTSTVPRAVAHAGMTLGDG
ncbi:MAG: DUF2244 domain-containing protein [Panacagrimonas sp.]